MGKSPGQKIEETGYETLAGFERKHLPTFVKSYDEDQGIVEHFVAIMGNVDEGGDRIMPNAFVKSINERGNRVKVLDMHSMDSVTRIVGRPLELREVGKSELTPEVLAYAPDATGGLLAKTQYAIDTTRGRDVFNLVKGGYAPESSIGYDATQQEHTKERGPDGKERVVRNLNQIRLWEYSNVVFGMNPATAIVSAKAKDEAKPSEGKPYGVIEEDGKYCVYKLDADGNPTGERLGEHDTEAEAEVQRRALYANEEGEDKAAWSAAYINDLPDSSFLLVESGGEKDGDGKTTPRSLRHLPYKDTEGNVDLPHLRNAISRLGQADTGATGGEKWLTEEVRKRLLGRARGILENANKSDDGKAMDTTEMGKMRRMMRMMQDMMAMMGDMMGGAESDEHGKSLKAGRVLSARNAKRIKAAMDELHSCLMDAGLMEMMPDDDTGPHKAATPSTSDSSGSQPEQDGAGTDTDDSTRLLKLIELELEETEV